jgi:hypothetical protein
MDKDKYKRQREQRAAEHVRKAFERFDDALATMGETRALEEWTPDELEKLTKIVNEWASTILRIAQKMKKRQGREFDD